ncbi:MAG TPA: hypothetical protein VJB67_02295 [Patescibacteria group bacterium]|nr:hypothetical protein [Patescibacteria group bacterium]
MTSGRKKNYSPLIWGIFGAIGASVVFYLIQTLTMQSLTAPFYFLTYKWYFILPLIFGLAVQIGIFRAIHLKVKQGGGAVIASGGVSTIAMVACCIHNLVILLPILGLSGLAIFFSTYQNYVLGFSILFVIGGVIYLWRKYQKIHTCCQINT